MRETLYCYPVSVAVPCHMLWYSITPRQRQIPTEEGYGPPYYRGTVEGEYTSVADVLAKIEKQTYPLVMVSLGQKELDMSALLREFARVPSLTHFEAVNPQPVHNGDRFVNKLFTPQGGKLLLPPIYA